MQFVKSKDLKVGMRLARPIYNKEGVLLYERDSKLTAQGIASIANFGLIGLFILEPAEPVPPMTEEDLEFERFQTMSVFSIQEELNHILNAKKQSKLQIIADRIIKNYGHLDKKINFIQNLRSKEDYIYKHSLNVAILCAMMCHVLNLKRDEQLPTILAAIVHDMGKLTLPPDVNLAEPTEETEKILRRAETGAYELIESALSEGTMVRRICMQSERIIAEAKEGQAVDMKCITGAMILAVADMYDSMTAMQLEGAPRSEVEAIRFLMDRPECFDAQIVRALIDSINILVAGISVELNTGEKALVLRGNEDNILRPMVLSFRDNSIIDLDNRENRDIEIIDIMKTLDNRYIFDTESLAKAGFSVTE
ncbi:MAG: HD domain-containing protein [Lachnospiraceae bacterium]|nr:HD domain-containing protein [Lachnospiraceae bacterium]